MAFTQGDLDELHRIAASGVLRGKINGEEVEYRNMAELQSVIRLVEAQLGGAAGPAIRVSYPRTGRGL